MNRVLLLGLIGFTSCFVKLNSSRAQVAASGSAAIQTTDYFPPEVAYWQQAEKPLVRGVELAEALRAKLLSIDPHYRPIANEKPEPSAVPRGMYFNTFCDAVKQFQAQCKSSSEGKSIDNFQMTAERLASQLKGKQTLSPNTFDAFDGKWFGNWDGMMVNHDWKPSKIYNPPRELAAGVPPMAALQYAWISNGFGWNYLSSLDGSGAQNYVLGMVYYFEGSNYRDTVGEKPHVGFADSPTRLVWITEKEVYLEEAFVDTTVGDYYVITGLRHDLFSETPTISPDAVQAIYTRDPHNRPAFRKFTWNPN